MLQIILSKPSVEDKKMSNSKQPNMSIRCTVQQCKYHCNYENYCSLDSILVGTHEQNPTKDDCTDCKSFDVK